MSYKIPENELLDLPTMRIKKRKIYVLNHLGKTNL
jgi:hypothetical protein